MKRFISLSLALASAGVAASTAHGARAKYGGTLRVDVDVTLRSLDPAAASDDSVEGRARGDVLGLVFETLVAADADGLRPLLASAWESDARGARWTFQLRPGVRLHDGSVLAAWQVATALRAAEPGWTIDADGDNVVVNTGEPIRDLPWAL